jgi:hypothetical protein
MVYPVLSGCRLASRLNMNTACCYTQMVPAVCPDHVPQGVDIEAGTDQQQAKQPQLCGSQSNHRLTCSVIPSCWMAHPTNRLGSKRSEECQCSTVQSSASLQGPQCFLARATVLPCNGHNAEREQGSSSRNPRACSQESCCFDWSCNHTLST